MQAQTRNTAGRLFAFSLLPLLVLLGCSDDPLPGPDLSSQSAQASFDATNYWPSYGEDIRTVGNQVFSFRTSNGGDGYNVQIRSESMAAQFNGLSSGDAYEYAWDGPSEYSLNGPVGARRDLQETITLVNERTGQQAEGLVVATAELMPGGGVAFTVKEVINLP